MIILTIAFRNLLRRKSRMLAIGMLVFFGTLLIIMGESFSLAAKLSSRNSIIEYFTGDFILYAGRSREKPTPFAFTTPLPLIQNVDQLLEYLMHAEEVASFVPLAQNYSLISLTVDDQKVELPFIYYAIDPLFYARTFHNLQIHEGSYFGMKDPGSKGPVAEDNRDYESGILLSRFQRDVFMKNYNVALKAGEILTVLGVTPGGAVNAVKTKLLGFFEPRHYTNVFNYINLIDMQTYSTLYNFSGVNSNSLPEEINKIFTLENEADIFALGNDEQSGLLDTAQLQAEVLSGYTMVYVKLKDHTRLDGFVEHLTVVYPDIKVARWDEASGGFASISSAFQILIYIFTLFVFLVVILIFMNTLIINVIERTAEIGTLRAIGSERSFIRGIFLAETFMLNLGFAFLGSVVSLFLLGLFAGNGIPLPELLSQYLIGGGNLPIRFYPRPFLEALLIVSAVSLLATVYPLRVATGITPLKAMSEK